MIAIDNLMSQLSHLGISISLEGDQLRVRAAPGTLTPEIKSSLATHKQALVALLRDGESQTNVQAISPAPRNRAIPLSHAQQGLWLIHQLEGGGPTYNLLEALSIHGPLDLSVLEQTILTIADRHEILRTTFIRSDQQPTQRIASHPSTVPFALIDISNTTDCDGAIRQWARGELQHAFDLVNGPLARYFVLRLAPEHHVLAFSVHHIVCDAWSLRIIVDEIAQIYPRLAAGEPTGLSPLGIQYADFAVWDIERVNSQQIDAQREYWKQQLAGSPTVIEHYADRPRPSTRTFEGGVVELTLDHEIYHGLIELAKARGVTTYTALLAALTTLLARYTGQHELLIGSPVLHRTPETQDLVGFFINTVVMRLAWQADWSSDDLLERTQDVVAAALANKDVPFARVVQDLRPPRSAAYTPIFQVLFAFLKGVIFPPVHAGNLTIERYRLPEVTAKFDLNFSIEDGDGSCICRIEYSSDLFNPSTIQRLAEHFEQILHGMVADSRREVGSLQLESMRAPIVARTPTHPPQDLRTVMDLFAEQVEQHPDASALMLDDTSMSYAALNSGIQSVIAELRNQGIERGDVVGLYCERSIAQIVALLGILSVGAACLPLDIDYPDERLAIAWADSGASMLLTSSSLAPAAQKLFNPHRLATINSLSATSVASLPTAKPEDLAYVLFTSGSTGRPKGVAFPHRALANLTTWQINHPDFAPGLRTLQFAPISFDVSFQEISTTLCSGGCLVLIGEHDRREPTALLDLIETRAVERMFLPFIALEQLCQSAVATQRKLPSLREVYVAGEQLRISDTIRAFFAGLPNCTLCNQYGPTETHVITSHRLDRDPSQWPVLPAIGTPIANVEIHLLDSELRALPIGPIGEIYASGVALADGYIGRPELTAERFVEIPVGANQVQRAYKTGDLARWNNDGSLQFFGRADTQLKIRGFRVEPGDIEAALVRHPDVLSAAVVGHSSASGRLLVAYYIPSTPDRPPSTGELQRYLGASLPEYMIPSIFVKMAEFPKTPSGKLDRKSLPPPSTDREDLETEYIGPSTAIEQALVEVWSKVLEFDLVGVNDDFFELGGHSLSAAQILAWIEDAYGVKISQATLFREPTVVALAKHIEQLLAESDTKSSHDSDRITGEL